MQDSYYSHDGFFKTFGFDTHLGPQNWQENELQETVISPSKIGLASKILITQNKVPSNLQKSHVTNQLLT